MNLKKAAEILILAVLIFALYGCGAQKKSDGSAFTVDYVAQAGLVNPTIIMVGKYKGETAKMDINSFKDCKFISMDFINGADVVFKGTEDGYLMIDGGIKLSLSDKDGKEHKLEIKEGSSFKLEEAAEGWRLILQ